MTDYTYDAALRNLGLLFHESACFLTLSDRPKNSEEGEILFLASC